MPPKPKPAVVVAERKAIRAALGKHVPKLSKTRPSVPDLTAAPWTEVTRGTRSCANLASQESEHAPGRLSRKGMRRLLPVRSTSRGCECRFP